MNFLSWIKSLPWKRIGLISLCSVLALILIVSIFVTAYVDHLFSLLKPPATDPTGDTGPNYTTEGTTPTLPSGYTGPTVDVTQVTTAPEPEIIISSENYPELVNIMLVGQDRRPGEIRTRSDAMILCTFNTKNKTITLTSFMRDLYVNIPGKQPYKMNQAYAWGGMPLLRETVLENFGVYIDAFVEVDFSGFESIVEVLGGVSISLTQAEADHLNSEYGWTLSAGTQTLNGSQALAYSRIRKIGTDFARTERQRNVINSILNACKSKSFTELDRLLKTILPLIATDMSSADILGYATKLFPLLSGDFKSQRVPIDGSYELTYVISGNTALDVVLPDIELNRQYLLETLLPK